MLDEGVQIMRQLWTTGTATLDGKHYQVDGAIVRPLPLQDGGIPLWIAGGGEKKTLRIAAQYAAVHELRRHARGVRAQVGDPGRSTAQDVGPDFDAITRSANYNVVIGETEKEVAGPARLDAATTSRRYVPAERRRRARMRNFANGPLVGTPEQIVERLAELGELGMTLRDHSTSPRSPTTAPRSTSSRTRWPPPSRRLTPRRAAWASVAGQTEPPNGTPTAADGTTAGSQEADRRRPR